MKELPLFDSEAAIACTIEPHQKPGRRDLLDQMRKASTGVERTESGVLFSFPPGSEGVFEEFALAEKQCCAFFGFHVGVGEMVWDAPPAAAEIMDTVYLFLTDDSTSLEDLLVPVF